MKRPYFQSRIDELEALVRDQGTTTTTLMSIQKELEHRHTWRAQRLRRVAQGKLDATATPKPAIETEAGLNCQETKLSRLNLSTRARNVVISQRIETVAALSQYSESQLLRLPNVGRKTLNEFRSILRSFGLGLGRSMERLPFDAENERPILLTQVYIEEPADLRGALLAHVRSVAASDRNTDWTIRHFGWDGRPGRTLESIGREAKVTRERVRQVAAKCCRSLQARGEIPERLKSAVEIVKRNVPLTQDELDRLLKEAKLADEGFSFESIESAAAVFGIPFPYCTFGKQHSLIIEKRQAQLPAKFLRSVKLEVAAHGAIVDEQLIAICTKLSGTPIALPTRRSA